MIFRDILEIKAILYCSLNNHCVRRVIVKLMSKSAFRSCVPFRPILKVSFYVARAHLSPSIDFLFGGGTTE